MLAPLGFTLKERAGSAGTRQEVQGQSRADRSRAGSNEQSPTHPGGLHDAQEWLRCSSMGSHRRYPKPTAAGALQTTIQVSRALFLLHQSADLSLRFE